MSHPSAVARKVPVPGGACYLWQGLPKGVLCELRSPELGALGSVLRSATSLQNSVRSLADAPQRSPRDIISKLGDLEFSLTDARPNRQFASPHIQLVGTLEVPVALLGATKLQLHLGDVMLTLRPTVQIPLLPPALESLLSPLIREHPCVAESILRHAVHVQPAVEVIGQAFHLIFPNNVEVVGIPLRTDSTSMVMHALESLMADGALRLPESATIRLKKCLATECRTFGVVYASETQFDERQLPHSSTALQSALEGWRDSSKLRAFPCSIAEERSPYRSRYPSLNISFPAGASDEEILRVLSPLVATNSKVSNFYPARADQPPSAGANVSEHAKVYSAVAGRADELLKHGSPIIIPHAEFAEKPPETLASGLTPKDDFALRTPQGEDFGRYRAACWRWRCASVLIGSDHYTAEAEVRFHTKISDALRNNDPCFVVALFLRHDKDPSARRGWCLLHPTACGDIINQAHARNIMVLDSEDGRLWLPFQEKELLHLHTSRLEYLARVASKNPFADVREKALKSIAELSDKVNFILPLIHFPYRPELDRRNAAWVSETPELSRFLESGPERTPRSLSITERLKNLLAKAPLHSISHHEIKTLIVGSETSTTGAAFVRATLLHNDDRHSSFLFDGKGTVLSSICYSLVSSGLYGHGTASYPLLAEVVELLESRSLIAQFEPPPEVQNPE